jgi:plastocyanin domain-containing protein
MLLSTITRDRRPAGRDARTWLFVRVRGGYRPDELHAPAGVPLAISFLREEAAACSERVIFPQIGLSATLPEGREVPVEIPALAPGHYDFTCQLGLLRGTLVIEAARP